MTKDGIENPPSNCSSVDDYCQKLTDLSNQLAVVDQPISESQLILQLVRGLPIEYNNTAALINQQGVDWDQTLSILKDKVIRVDAHQTPLPTVLAAPAAPLPSASTTHNLSPGQSFSNRGRGRGRHQHFRGRGVCGRGSGRYQGHQWSTSHSPYPNWAWWNTPCPYPTQPPWRPSPYPAP
ncbi:hypothetical protein E3N88_09869 [Mikania micrantha]|uniref:Uncharacterized protein n=1 Tax=Mikania micrantha TaxID=192012 RepID=A0A5N6PML5_9ASTR|nr:hypothetical protein E3N88_09869 [Mikania micrantha]